MRKSPLSLKEWAKVAKAKRIFEQFPFKSTTIKVAPGKFVVLSWGVKVAVVDRNRKKL